MANSHSYVKEFFADLGLSLVRDDRSRPLFENFVTEGCGPSFCVRATRDRQSETIELCARSESTEWFDLAIVMTLMLTEAKLFDEVSLQEQLAFVKTHFDELTQLFHKDVYLTIKPRLKELELYRARIRFPEWYS